MSKEEYPEIELYSNLDGNHGSGTLTRPMYKIEVRSNFSDPTGIKISAGNGEFRDFVIDFVWRTLPISVGSTSSGFNVPTSYFDQEGAKHGLLSYTAAQAHIWGFFAMLEATRIGGYLCIEARLVNVEFSQHYLIKELGVSDKLMIGNSYKNELNFHPRNLGTDKKI